MRVDLEDHQHVVVLTGAGISVASGLPTYRGPGGLWEELDAAALSSADGWARDPAAVWEHAVAMRREPPA
jgi:NAD-dependent SIR2 family protein deacetylase